MVHTFKFGGQRIAYDSVSGLVLPLTELAYKMFDYIELPMPRECSSALRYDLAKFDSKAIGETYDQLYTLYSEGKLFAEETAEPQMIFDGAAIAIGDELCTRENPHPLDMVKRLAEEGKDVAISIIAAPDAEAALTAEDVPALTKEFEKIAKEQAKRAKGEGVPFRAFEERCHPVHDAEACSKCWAKKLCSLAEPHDVMCELERKRVECVMMVKAAEESE